MGANGGPEFACGDILRVRGGSLIQQMLVNYLLNHRRAIYRNRERKTNYCINYFMACTVTISAQIKNEYLSVISKNVLKT